MTPSTRPAVFLDRDGVLNEAILRNGRPYPPAGVEEVKVATDAAAALARLEEAGFLLIVVTNQPDVARGVQTREAVAAIHRALADALPIDDFMTCWHDDRDACRCRKPKPGLILEAARKHGIDLDRSFVVGDRWRDIDAGAAAGCRTVLISRSYDERPPANDPNFSTASLNGAVDWILAQGTSAALGARGARRI